MTDDTCKRCCAEIRIAISYPTGQAQRLNPLPNERGVWGIGADGYARRAQPGDVRYSTHRCANLFEETA